MEEMGVIEGGGSVERRERICSLLRKGGLEVGFAGGGLTDKGVLW